jgi:hypothetical protein
LNPPANQLLEWPFEQNETLDRNRQRPRGDGFDRVFQNKPVFYDLALYLPSAIELTAGERTAIRYAQEKLPTLFYKMTTRTSKSTLLEG